MTGNLPHEIGFLPALHSISLGWNSLSGTLPASLAIVMKERAYQVVLHGNSFSGTLPVEWCQFQNVRRLGLSDNELTGTIPTEIGQLGAGPGGEEALLGLFLYGNDGLSGTVPTEIGNLGALG